MESNKQASSSSKSEWLFFLIFSRSKIGVQKPQEDFLIGFTGALIWELFCLWEALHTFNRTWALLSATVFQQFALGFHSWFFYVVRVSSSQNHLMVVPSQTCLKFLHILVAQERDMWNIQLIGVYWALLYSLDSVNPPKSWN